MACILVCRELVATPICIRMASLALSRVSLEMGRARVLVGLAALLVLCVFQVWSGGEKRVWLGMVWMRGL